LETVTDGTVTLQWILKSIPVWCALDPPDPGYEPVGSLLNTVTLQWILKSILVCCGLDPAGPGYDQVGNLWNMVILKWILNKYTGKLYYRLDPPGPGYDPVGYVSNTAMNFRPTHKGTNCLTRWVKTRSSRTGLAIN
jgi:hypothetical protein